MEFNSGFKGLKQTEPCICNR